MRNSECGIDWVRKHWRMKEELEKRTKLFALHVINFGADLPSNRTCAVIGRQLLKSGTSIGANYCQSFTIICNAF
jgi:hypothetical protein